MSHAEVEPNSPTELKLLKKYYEKIVRLKQELKISNDQLDQKTRESEQKDIQILELQINGEKKDATIQQLKQQLEIINNEKNMLQDLRKCSFKNSGETDWNDEYEAQRQDDLHNHNELLDLVGQLCAEENYILEEENEDSFSSSEQGSSD